MLNNINCSHLSYNIIMTKKSFSADCINSTYTGHMYVNAWSLFLCIYVQFYATRNAPQFSKCTQLSNLAMQIEQQSL